MRNLIGMFISLVGLATVANAADSTNCPIGTRAIGKAPPKGFEWYCAKVEADGFETKQGSYIKWHDNRTKAVETIYVNGAINGKYQSWFHNGAKHQEGAFASGRQVGHYVEFYPSGKKRFEGEYNDGVLVGKGQWFDASGKPTDGMTTLCSDTSKAKVRFISMCAMTLNVHRLGTGRDAREYCRCVSAFGVEAWADEECDFPPGSINPDELYGNNEMELRCGQYR